MKTITGLKIDNRGTLIVSWLNGETSVTSHYVLESFETEEASLDDPLGALAIHIMELNDALEMLVKNCTAQDEINDNSMAIQTQLVARLERLELLTGHSCLDEGCPEYGKPHSHPRE
jgi:hypothetical protein